jgi:hypothetical protein
MADDWQVGDLAEYIGNQKDCPTCIGPMVGRQPNGTHMVLEVVHLPYPTPTCGLRFLFAPTAACSCGWRKIRPHTPDADDLATIRLMRGKPVRTDA